MCLPNILIKAIFTRAGNACYKKWINFRRKFGGLLDLISIEINPLHFVINKIESHIFSFVQKNAKYVIVPSKIGAQQICRNYLVEEKRFLIIPPR